MALDLFTPVVPREALHPNFVHVAGEEDDAVRAVLRDWADGFVDRDGKFVDEFQRTFNSSWWELYLHAVLKSLGIRLDFTVDAPDFVAPEARLAIEATIASHGQDARPEWLKTVDDLTRVDAIQGRYIETLARLSNSVDAKARRYRDRYAGLAHMADKAYVIAIHNFGTPDAHQLGDVAMQRLLYDVWEEKKFPKSAHVELPTGLFLDDRLKDISAVMFSSVATFGKARALSDSKGEFVFHAVRILDNVRPLQIAARKADYRESLRDGLRIFHNPNAERPLDPDLFMVDDIRQFRLLTDGAFAVTCHPEGDLVARQVHHLKERQP